MSPGSLCVVGGGSSMVRWYRGLPPRADGFCDGWLFGPRLSVVAGAVGGHRSCLLADGGRIVTVDAAHLGAL